jgi:hypothetical protein
MSQENSYKTGTQVVAVGKDVAEADRTCAFIVL